MWRILDFHLLDNSVILVLFAAAETYNARKSRLNAICLSSGMWFHEALRGMFFEKRTTSMAISGNYEQGRHMYGVVCWTWFHSLDYLALFKKLHVQPVLKETVSIAILKMQRTVCSVKLP